MTNGNTGGWRPKPNASRAKNTRTTHEPTNQATLPGTSFPGFEPQAIQGLLTEMAALLEGTTAPEAFHGVFLQRVIAAFGALGGAQTRAKSS